MASWLAGSAPTRCVGESAVRSVGYCSSSVEQLAIQPVVLRVGDRRPVEDVVLVRRALDLRELGAQRRSARARQLGDVERHSQRSAFRFFVDHLHRDRHQPVELLVGRLRQQRLRPDVIVALRVAVEQAADERDERDALQVGVALAVRRRPSGRAAAPRSGARCAAPWR